MSLKLLFVLLAGVIGFVCAANNPTTGTIRRVHAATSSKLNHVNGELNRRKRNAPVAVPAVTFNVLEKSGLGRMLKNLSASGEISVPGSLLSGHPTTLDFKTTTIILSHAQAELTKYFNHYLTDFTHAPSRTYCNSGTKVPSNNNGSRSYFTSTGDVIQMFRSVSTTRRQHLKWDAHRNPVQEYGQQEIKPNIFAPLYIRADIRYTHLRSGHSRPTIPTTIYNHLHENMGYQQQPGNVEHQDMTGHLLPASLGGTSNETYNFIPMTQMLHRGPGFEHEVERFLNRNRSGRVDWHMAVFYNQNPISPYRPVGISINLRLYTNAADAQPSFSSYTYTLSNNPSSNLCLLETVPNIP
ncbi:hypothetical protein HA402_000597 [Bradysia odoriphaga]|nr:hypothetical protein HA402_000597 [Bradysia odoriphaga]